MTKPTHLVKLCEHSFFFDNDNMGHVVKAQVCVCLCILHAGRQLQVLNCLVRCQATACNQALGRGDNAQFEAGGLEQLTNLSQVCVEFIS